MNHLRMAAGVTFGAGFGAVIGFIWTMHFPWLWTGLAFLLLSAGLGGALHQANEDRRAEEELWRDMPLFKLRPDDDTETR